MSEKMVAIENIPSENSPSEKMNPRELVVSQVKGRVKWFNVDLGYGFINRHDNNEDVFVHHTAITKYNPKHQLSSLADNELVEFDVVKGKKGLEAINVSGPEGAIVKGSRFATNLYAGRYRFRRGSNISGRPFYGRRFFGPRPRQDSIPADDEHAPNEEKNISDVENEKTTKKYSKNRKFARPTGEGASYRRSNSLPPDFGRYSNQPGGRRRRRFGRGGWTPFRFVQNGEKRVGGRGSHKENKQIEKGLENQNSVGKKDNIAKVDTQGNDKTEVQNVTTEEVSVGRRSNKSETSLKPPSEKSGNSSKRDTKPKNSNSESGGNVKRNGTGKRSGKGRRRRFTTGPRGSSTEVSTQTPSAKENKEKKLAVVAADDGKYVSADEGKCEEAKFGSPEEDKRPRGGDGDRADVKGEVVG